MKPLRIIRSAWFVCVVPVIAAGCHIEQWTRSLTDFDADARAVLASMTLEEKIGQMIQAESSRLRNPSDIQTYYLGSVLSGGGADPRAGNSLEAWTDMVDGFQTQAMSTRLKIPLLYGIDAVHGHNNVLGAIIFPHNIGLGCTRDPKLVERIARITAVEVRATGIQWNFAPCITVPRDERWGRTYEGFSEDPDLVSLLGAAVRAFGQDLSDPLSLLACAKHYVGDGELRRGRGWTTAGIRVIPGLMRRRCADSFGAIFPPSRPASAPLCPPTAVGTAPNAPATNTC